MRIKWRSSYSVNPLCVLTSNKPTGNLIVLTMKRSVIFLWLAITLLFALSGCQSMSVGGLQHPDPRDFFRYSQLSDLSAHPHRNSVLFTQMLPGESPAVFSYSFADKTYTRHSPEEGAAQYAIGFLPDKQGRTRVLFSQAAADGGQHVLVNDHGTLFDLTPGSRVQARFVGWGEDRHYLFLAVRYAGSDSQKLIRYRTDNFAATPVFENKFDLPISAVSISGRYVSGKQVSADNEDRIYVADVSYPEPVYHWLTSDNAAALSGPLAPLTFSLNGQSLFFTAQTPSAGRQAYAWTMADNHIKALPRIPGNVTAINNALNHDMAVEFVSNGRRSITVFNSAGEQRYTSPASRNSWSLRFINTKDTSQDLDIVMMQAGDDFITGPVRVTPQGSEYLADKHQPPVSPVRAKEVSIRGFDGQQIPAQLYRPSHADANNPVSAVVYGHEGFDSFYTATYHPAVQHLVASGYAVLAVNYRGSSGFGEAFRQLNDERQGQDDSRDLIQAAEYLGAQTWVNADKIAVMGDNYGGFLALSAAMKSGTFKAAVNCFGITNWLQFLQSVPPWLPDYRTYLQKEFGDFEKNASRLSAISPAFHAQKIGVPVFIAQGEKDRFVTLQQTDEFVATLKESGVEVDYAVFDDEGHGLQRTRNKVILQQRIVAFLDKHVSQ